MTKIDMYLIEQLANKATPGPWEWVERGDRIYLGNTFIALSGHYEDHYERCAYDIAFIAAALSAVPHLIAEVRRLRVREVELLAANNAEVERRRAAERGAKLAKWQPIETAPKDGTVFLAADNDGWVWESFYIDDIDGFDACCHGVPTHWMPLPAPPVAP
jgi:hypothetical protein